MSIDQGQPQPTPEAPPVSRKTTVTLWLVIALVTFVGGYSTVESSFRKEVLMNQKSFAEDLDSLRKATSNRVTVPSFNNYHAQLGQLNQEITLPPMPQQGN